MARNALFMCAFTDSDNLLQAKKGGGLAPPRKPLHDKAVNEISPQRNTPKLQKGKELSVKEISPKISPKLFNNDLWADVCSYKDIEGLSEKKTAHDLLFVSFNF